jgi:very-short-patch-repair endonuclease
MTAPVQKIRARSLRKSANLPEQRAWDALRSLRQQGFPVRRQHPIGRYIVDFAITKAKLVVEINGGIHNMKSVAEKDGIRESEISALGWRVVRVPASMAMSADHLLALLQKELGI